MAFNKSNKKIVTTALTAAMVASAVAPAAAATKVTPQQDATNKVSAYEKKAVRNSADAKTAAAMKTAAQDAIKKLTSSKDAALKTKLTGKVNAKAATDSAVQAYTSLSVVKTEADWANALKKKDAALKSIATLVDANVKKLYTSDVNAKATVQYNAIIALRAVNTYVKLPVIKTEADWANALKKKDEALKAIAKLTDASLKASYTKSVNDRAAVQLNAIYSLRAENAVTAFEKFEVKEDKDADQAKKLKDAATAAVANVAKGDKAAAEKLTARIDAKDKKNQEVLGAPVVTGVSAINGKEIKVTFNKEVDANSAEDEGNYKLLNGSSPLASSDFEANLQDDNKTVILTLNNAISKDTTAKFSVTIQNVLLKGSYLEKIAYYAGVVTVADTKAPEISSVTSVTNSSTASSVTVNFSEPVVSPTIKIDGVTQSATLSSDGYSAKVSNLSLSASASHTVEAVNLTDAAGNVTASSSKSFSVTSDTAAATYTVSTVSDNQIVLTYNKAMDVNTVLAGTVLKDGNLDTVANYQVAVKPNSGNKVFTITIGNLSKPFSASKTSANYTVVSANTIADYLGNRSAATTATATLTYDTTKPTVSNITYVKDSAGVVSKVLVKYSEAVTAVNSNALSIVNLTTGSTVVSSTGVSVLSDGQTVEYTLPASTKLSGQYEVKLADSAAADTSFEKNPSVASKQTVDFGAGAATALNVKTATVTNNSATIVFDSTVTYSTATNPANYTINGVALPAGTTITLGTNTVTNDQVTFNLPANFITANDTGAVLRVANVTTPSNVTVSTNQKVVAVLDNTGAKISKTASAVNSNGTLTLGFDEAVKVLATTQPLADLTLNLGGVTVDTSNSSVQSKLEVTQGIGGDAGKLVLKFVTNQDTVNGGAAADATATIGGAAASKVAKGTLNNATTTTTATTTYTVAADKTVSDGTKTVATLDASGNATINQGGVTFTITAAVPTDVFTIATTAAVPAVQASKTEYFDANGNGKYDAASDILVKQVTGTDAANYNFVGTLDLNKVSSITVGTKDSNLASIVDTTGQNNKLQTKQSVQIK